MTTEALRFLDACITLTTGYILDGLSPSDATAEALAMVQILAGEERYVAMRGEWSAATFAAWVLDGARQELADHD